MMQLADRVKFWLETQPYFIVFRNKPGWTLAQTAIDCNQKDCDLFIDNHTNAGSIEKAVDGKCAEGTEVFYCGPLGITSKSYKIASILYKHISPLSEGGDRGVKPDTSLYSSGLYIIRHTIPPACLIEHIFHTNYAEVADFLMTLDEFAKAEAKAICEYFGVTWKEPITEVESVGLLVDELVEKGVVTDRDLWYKVLMGEKQANPEYLQIAFRRAIQKIK